MMHHLTHLEWVDGEKDCAQQLYLGDSKGKDQLQLVLAAGVLITCRWLSYTQLLMSQVVYG